MNVFITTGTYDYLKKIAQKYENEKVILMQNEETALLYHETEGESFFNEPRRYELVDGSGDIQKGQFFVMNHVPVTEEGRPVFEHRLKNRARLIDLMKGFIGIRVLRPLSSDTYIILTGWENEGAFENWQNSRAFDNAHPNTHDPAKGHKIFPRPSYVAKYAVPVEE